MKQTPHSDGEPKPRSHRQKTHERVVRIVPKNANVDRRFLPQPGALVPEEDEQDAQIEARFNPVGGPLSLYDEDDPELQEIAAAEQALAARKANVIALRTQSTLRGLAQSMDPQKVEEYCAAEPWKKGKLTDLSRNLFGFVPEKFELLAQEHEEGSPLNKEFMGACMAARKIYNEQLQQESWKVFQNLKHKTSSPREHRSQLETISRRINAFYKSELEEEEQAGGPFKHQSGRLRKAGMLLGYYFMNGRPGYDGKPIGKPDQHISPDGIRMVIKPLGDPMPANPDEDGPA